MDRLKVNPSRLNGHVNVSGAKNSALSIISASLLAEEEVLLRNVPFVSDVCTQIEILQLLGAKVQVSDTGCLRINPSNISHHKIPYEITKRSRGSILFLSSILSKLGKVEIGLPGGDAIGARPLDLHLKGLVAMGAKVTINEDSIELVAKGLTGGQIFLDRPSTTATENLLIAASLAKGRSVIENVEKVAEISDLADFLRKMGAKIEGEKTGVVTIEGIDRLTSTDHTLIPDPFEAGTYLAAAAITKGDIVVQNANPTQMIPTIAKLREIGAKIWVEQNGLHITCETINPTNLFVSAPYPAFQSDMQPIFTTLLTLANGTSEIVESVFPKRFCYTRELKKMNAKITIDSNKAIVEGVGKLTGANVNAEDIRGGASLVLAALGAEGSSEISGINQIDRGYENFEDKLGRLGADIRRV